MTDLKALAYEFLHEAQNSLKADGYLNPTAIVITPNENLIFDLSICESQYHLPLIAAV